MIHRAVLYFDIDDQGSHMDECMLLAEAKRRLVVMGFTRRWPNLRVTPLAKSRMFPVDVLDAEVIVEGKPTFEPKLHAARKRRTTRRGK